MTPEQFAALLCASPFLTLAAAWAVGSFCIGRQA